MQRIAFALALGSTALPASAQITLTPDTLAVSAFDGGSQALQLDAGAANAGELYFLLGSAAGTSPGVSIAGLTVPLNPDFYADLSLSQPNGPTFQNSLGFLDGAGRADAVIALPADLDPSVVGIELNHAALVFSGAEIAEVSEASPLVLVEQTLLIETPLDGSTVGSPLVDVSGSVGDLLSGTPGLSIAVNGVPATVVAGSGGEVDRFELPNVQVPLGSSSLEVVATNAAGEFERRTANIDLPSLTPNNVVIADGFAYAALGNAGLAIVDLDTRQLTSVPAPSGTNGVDDLAIDGDLLFLLDAGSAGRLSAFDIATPDAPTQVAGPINVAASPFSGVSAGGGRAVVSGGTSLLRVYAYDAAGNIAQPSANVDLGVGQPDVHVSSDGERAFVSTDFALPFPQGQSFGVTLLDLNTPPTLPTTLARTGLPGAGFTPGGTGPANFAIESAELSSTEFLTAHGGGLTRLASTTGAILETQSLPFPAVNVDAFGGLAFVVGGSSLGTVDYSSGGPVPVSIQTFTGSLSGVAADGEFLAIAANAGGLIVQQR